MHRRSLWLGIALSIALVASAGIIFEPNGFRAPDAPMPGIASAANDSAVPRNSGDPVRLSVAATRVRDEVESMLAAAVAATEELTGAVDSEAAPKTKKSKRARKRQKRDAKPSTKRRLKLVTTITGGLTPKSIVSAQNGKVFAMNMMYNHTITVFNRRYKRAKVIDDSVDLSKFGYKQYDHKVRGAPVEAALDPKRKHMYVSNYSMYGPGFRDQGFDLCKASDKIDRSFVYQISTRTLRKTDAIEVGEVPKYLAVTPNGRYLLVSNWCSWDISVVDLKKGKETRRIDAGVAPRGIAFSPNSKTAYVTLVGEDKILVIDMRTFKVKREISGIGERPRHLVMSPGGRYLYITVQGEDKKRAVDGRILKYDTHKRKIVARSEWLTEPRTTVMSDDGKSIYVVDYYPGTLVKLRASDLKELQTKYLGFHPIGVTYDDASDKLWVSGYGGSVWVLKDR
ncbi:MAG: YncE family protein [Chloroflexota bacterium]|nr:YncE family protein [Chloroflexota bacterium]